jgi:hypothetical protein
MAVTLASGLGSMSRVGADDLGRDDGGPAADAAAGPGGGQALAGAGER